VASRRAVGHSVVIGMDGDELEMRQRSNEDDRQRFCGGVLNHLTAHSSARNIRSLRWQIDNAAAGGVANDILAVSIRRWPATSAAQDYTGKAFDKVFAERSLIGGPFLNACERVPVVTNLCDIPLASVEVPAAA